MRIAVLLFACLLFQGVARADDVETAESSNSEDSKRGDISHDADQPQSQNQVQTAQQQQQQQQQPQQQGQDQNSDQLVLAGPDDKDLASASSNSAAAQYSTINLRAHSHSPGRGNMGLGPRPQSHHHGSASYHGPPPPPPQSASGSRPQESIDKVFDTAVATLPGIGDNWPASPGNDMPKIVSLDVKCEKNSMKVYLAFDKPFYGIVFSKGHYSNANCVYLPAGLGRSSVNFEIGIHACGTAGNTENALYGFGAETGSGTYFENIVVIQYDPQVQEVWDQARKLRCTWHDLYEKSVTFRPFPVDMLDVVRADFAGDNVGCWMQIQVGKGPWASEVSGLVKIGQTMTMVLAIKDDDSKFDMLVRNCMAHDGKRAPIQLVDQRGCITRPKLMSRFTKIKNFGASASVLSYAHFQAFKFPDSMEVHFQCTIQICRYQCPDQCSDSSQPALNHDGLLVENHHRSSIAHADLAAYGISPPPVHLPLDTYLQHVGAVGRPRDERRRRVRRAVEQQKQTPQKSVGVNRIIRVVSSGDLTFPIDEPTSSTNGTSTGTSSGVNGEETMVFPVREPLSTSGSSQLVCMSASGFGLALTLLLAVLVCSCGLSAYLCLRLRPFRKHKPHICFAGESGQSNAKSSSNNSCFFFS